MKPNNYGYARSEEPSFEELYPTLAHLGGSKPQMIDDCKKALVRARRFRKEVIDPNTLTVDRKAMNDPTYVAQEVIAAAAREHFFSMMIPKMFGGLGLSLGASMIAMEELAAGCLGLANLLGVHGLALTTVAATGDLEKMNRVCRLLAGSEKSGRPRLLSTAITEPGAGTDVEDVEFLRTARLSCEAKPAKGGYRLSGRKVFISNGSIAHTHVVIAPTDIRRPVETQWVFLVEAGTPGLSIGRVERKMGQKACPAAELVFDDCFVPERNRVGLGPAAGRSVDLVLGATRGAVGLWGAAVARGAFERALGYATTHKLQGKWLIDHQWVQFHLTDMYRNAQVGRAVAVQAMLANELFGLSSIMSGSDRLQQVQRWIPAAVYKRLPLAKMLASPRARKAGRRAIDALSERAVDTASAFGAVAKFSGTDLGMTNCHLAVQIMGTDGLRHDRGMEKLFRDAKLLQIYEGTNQLNRIETFKKAIRPALA